MIKSVSDLDRYADFSFIVNRFATLFNTGTGTSILFWVFCLMTTKLHHLSINHKLL